MTKITFLKDFDTFLLLESNVILVLIGFHFNWSKNRRIG